MTGLEDELDVERVAAESTLRFIMTLVVATVMVAVSAYVLSFAVLAPERMGEPHSASAVAQHTRS